MLKSLLWLLAAIALGVAGYSWRFAKTSYSTYSPEQLDLFARELARLSASDAGVTMEERVVAVLAADEQQRRQRVQVFSAAGLVLIALALIAPRWSLARRRPRGEAGESDRLKGFVGALSTMPRPGPMDKYRAAEALGVRMDASPAVIQAAFDALVKERDPRRKDGLAPDLQRLMEEQFRQLHEARSVLLGK